ncbi:MAG TPA: hypothetical protein VME01_08530 [Solirubrobacteraceae bacterium]|nr:hypothetical protein [Solirubrobacteraceae bacterium]
MELVRSHRGFLLAACLALLVTALVAVWIAVDLGGARTTLWVDDLTTPLAAGIACVMCLRARARHTGRMRLFWTLLGCATASWTIAEIVWGFYALILDQEVPSPSWADVGYLSAIPLTVAALVIHPAMKGNGTRKARSVLDGMVLATALLFLSWTLVLGALWHSTNLSTAGGIVTVAYPFGDVVIVFFIVLVIRGMTGAHRLSLWCLLAGLLAMALSDSIYTYLTETGVYTSSGANVIDAGWIAAYLGIALAAYSSTTSTAQDERTRATTLTPSRPSLASLTAPLLCVLLALTVAAVQIKLGHRLDHAAWLMAFALIALVLIRQVLAILELLKSPPEEGVGLTQKLTDAALGSVSLTGQQSPGTGQRP